MGIILRRLSKMQASTFLAAFLLISVFWCQANADDHEDEDEDDVHLHFHLDQDDQGDDVTLPPPPPTTTVSDEMTYNRRVVNYPGRERIPYKPYKPYISDIRYPSYQGYPSYRPKYGGPIYRPKPKYRDDAPWKQWSPAGNSRDPCSAIDCRPTVINNNGRGRRSNRFQPGFQSDDGRNFVSGCCSNSISLVGNVNGNVGR